MSVPIGSASLMTTPVASLGPWFVAMTLNVTVSPTAGVGLLTVFAIERFADAAALSDTLDWSFAGFKSNSTCAVLTAVLTIVPGAATVRRR